MFSAETAFSPVKNRRWRILRGKSSGPLSSGSGRCISTVKGRSSIRQSTVTAVRSSTPWMGLPPCVPTYRTEGNRWSDITVGTAMPPGEKDRKNLEMPYHASSNPTGSRRHAGTAGVRPTRKVGAGSSPLLTAEPRDRVIRAARVVSDVGCDHLGFCRNRLRPLAASAVLPAEVGIAEVEEL